MPTFSLGVTYIQLGDSATNSPASIDADDPLNVMVGFQIPLWRGAEKARQAEALNRIDEKAYLEQHLIAELQAELTQKVSQHTDALRRLRVYGDELLDLARQAVENSRAGYENGNTSLLEWIDSERSLLSLELDYWRAVADAHMHRIHIRTLTVPNLQTLLHEEN